MSVPRVLPTLILAFLLGASILAVQPAGAYPVSKAQEDAVDATFQDTAAPYGPWQTKIGQTVFYLHSGPTATETPDGGSVPFSLGAPPAATIDAIRPLAELADPAVPGPATQAGAIANNDPNDKTALIYGPAFLTNPTGYVPDPTGTTSPTMTFVLDGTPEDLVKAYGMDIRIWAACDTGNVNLPNQGPIQTNDAYAHIRAILRQQTFSDGEWEDTRQLSSVQLLPSPTSQNSLPGMIVPFTATANFGSAIAEGGTSSPALGDGPAFEPGKHRFTLELRLPEIGTNQYLYGAGCYIHYDSTSYPSRVTLRDDATRLAAFTQNTAGEQVSGFPRGTQADVASRRVVVQALQANAWPGGGSQASEENVKVRVLDRTTGQYVYYVDNINEGEAVDVDIRTMELLSSGVVSLSPTLVKRTFTLAYPQTLTTGSFQVELYNKGTPHKSTQWEAQMSQFSVGLRGLTLARAPGEIASHSVNPGEPTEFAFLLTNTGNEDDQVNVAVADPGAGWQAEIEGGGLYFLRPGGKAIGHVLVTPPATAVAGASRSVTVTAGSSFPDVTDPPALSFTTNLVAAFTPGVDISSTMSALTIRPGDTKTVDVAVANRGTARDSFVVLPIFPANIQGWTIIASPASIQVPAGAVENVQLRVRAPPEAPTGLAFPLGLSVQEVGNASVSDRLDITVHVFALEGLLVGVFDDVNRTLREDSEQCRGGVVGGLVFALEGCEFSGGVTNERTEDTDSDNSAIFRFDVQNLGDLSDAYKVTGFWDSDFDDMDDNANCESGNDDGGDGIPDGWRFNWQQNVGTGMPADEQQGEGAFVGPGFSGVHTHSDTLTQPFTVPPRTTRPAFLEIGYITSEMVGNGCGFNQFGNFYPDSTNSPAARYVITFESLNDPTRQQTHEVTVRLTPAGQFQGPNDYSGGEHLPAVLLDPGEAALKATNRGKPAVFNLTLVNTGNEHDDLEVSISNAPTGWTHSLVVKDSMPPGMSCLLPDEEGSFVCPGMGAFDEIHLQVIATPGANVRIGERDTVTVKVASGDAPGVERSLSMVARAAGVLDFGTGPLGATTRGVQPGSTVSFPLFVENLGTADDTYGITILRGDVATWRARVSTSSGLFVPAGREVSAFLTVAAPAGASPGETDVFTVQVESRGNLARKTIEFSPVLQAPSSLTVSGKDGQDVLVAQRAVDTPVSVVSVQTAGAAASPVTFTVDEDSLPHGWTVDRQSSRVPANPDASGRPTATAVFNVRAPPEALGTARGILRVEAAAGTLRGVTDINLNLASTFGLNLTALNATQVIAPGGSAIYNLTLRNLGLGQDTVGFTNTVLPTGWTMLFNPPSLTLGPLETQDIQAKLSAPATAKPGDVASVVAFAGSRTDRTQVSSVVLSATVGFNAIAVELRSEALPTASPQETVSFVFNVTNIGTLPDEIKATSVLDTIGQGGNVELGGGPASFKLNPGETIEATLLMELGPEAPGNITLQATSTWASLLDARPAASRATANATVQAKVLDYRFTDVNGDSLREYAVDRNEDSSDGYEQFQPTKTPGGRSLASADLLRFLRDDIRESFARDITLANGTTVRVIAIPLDGDGDGLRDHFLDGDGDGQPDFYWDPDANKASPIDFRKDVNGDQVPESFVDADGDGRVDSVYDLTRAEFTDVVQIDVDGNCQERDAAGELRYTAAECLDYVIDRDGDGQVDQDETVLYTTGGILLIVQKVDVDGDGQLDQVFDTDGDGNPDYFIPSGSEGSVPIVMRDITGDGTQDWTFDGNNDGRRESYYDPVTGEAHVIDAAGHFADAMKKYWYIGALFALVLILFVALILVTRK